MLEILMADLPNDFDAARAEGERAAISRVKDFLLKRFSEADRLRGEVMARTRGLVTKDASAAGSEMAVCRAIMETLK